MDASSHPFEVVHLPGKMALSRFRRDKLLARVRAIHPAIDALDVRFHYLIVTARRLEAEARARLAALLEASPSEDDADGVAACQRAAR